MSKSAMAGRTDKFIRKYLKSGLFYSNVKTDISVDFRICPFMNKTGKIYHSSICEGCYSAIILNVHPSLRRKLENAPRQSDWRLKLFIQDCQKIKEKFRFEKIRFYAFGDFHPQDIPYIVAASHLFTVDIISKTLAMPKFRSYLEALINEPNVWISLSFNKNSCKSMKPIAKLLKRKRASNVQFNYTLNYQEENPQDNKFNLISVFHTRNKNHRKLIDLNIPEERICGIWDREGNPVNNHGHCLLCTNCHTSFLTTLKMASAI